MDFESYLEFVMSRRSIRKYTNEKVDRIQIERLIEAACWAPSSHNRQGWKFIVFENHERIKELAEETRQFVRKALANTSRLMASQTDDLIHYSGAFDRAPVVVLVMHKKIPAMSKSMLSAATSELVSGEVISAAMACQNLLLAANSMGLGACVMTAPLLAGTVWNSLEDLPPGYEFTCLITVGHPSEAPSAPRRKKLKHVVEYR
ncbi:MAG: nitroreductase family protein [Phycisphaerales bacterium]|nr:MAG: nitroreductase family protein [Phycisphaerales bacterium]